MLTKPEGLRVFGLTGGIAAGKSEVARTWRALGLPVVDADAVSREQMRPGGTTYAAVLAEFGPGIVGADGQVDRPALAAIVFQDPAKRRRLEALTHAWVLAEVSRRLATFAEAGCRVAAVEAALILEAGLEQDLDGLVVVVASRDQRVRRAMARDGVGEATVQARMGAQVTDEERQSRATRVLANDGDLEALRRTAREAAIDLLLGVS